MSANPSGALRIGVRVAQYGGSWGHLREGALRAERLGFDSLWVNDHLRSPGRLAGEPTFDALTTLAALAPLTHRARLGTVVLSASYRPPALAAKMASVLDVISDGRLVLGLGTGSHEAEHEAYGFAFGSRRERTAGLRRAVDVIEAMLDHPDGATLAGELVDAPNRPAPVQRPRPPLWLAAHGPILLELAGRRADGVIAAFCAPQELARRRAMADRAREAAGREALACAIYTFVLPVPSQAEAERWLAADAAALGTEPRRLMRWLSTTGIVAPPDELRERLAEFAQAGATHAILSLPHRLPLEGLDAVAESVLEPAPERAPAAPRRGRVEDNLVELLVRSHARAGRGGDPAVSDELGEVSYDELATAAERAAGALAMRGVRRGDRVGIAVGDGRHWCAAFLGAAALGAVAVPLDAAAGADLLAATLADCAAAAVVRPAGAAPLPVPTLTPDELDAGVRRPVAPVEPGDLAYLVYSSGSTGRPKAAMHAHSDLRAGIETYATAILGLGPGDRCHSAARLHTSLGFGNGFFRVLGRGATAVMRDAQPRPAGVCALVERESVSVLTAVPTFWAQLARFGARRPDEAAALRRLRAAVSSGDGLSPAVAAGAREALGIELTQGLGCSECSNVVVSTRLGETADGSLGRPVPGIDVELRDEAGRPVAPGEPGRLWIRSASNTSGYWGRPDLTRDLVHGEWLRMGDMLVEGDDGRLQHLGRADALFKVDGRWVSPPQVEDALLGHPGVVEAAVVGREDERGLVRAMAAVVLEPGTERDGLDESLRWRVSERAGAHAVPRAIRVLDGLPRLSSGKLDRRALGAALDAPGP